MGIRLPKDYVRELEAKGLIPPELPTLKAKVTREGMNKLETRFATEYLNVRKLAGESIHWDFNKLRLKLTEQGSKSRWYKPDFREILPNGLMVLYETKGFMHDRDAVRIDVAADQHPHRLYVVRFDRTFGRFSVEAVPGLWDRLNLPEPCQC